MALTESSTAAWSTGHGTSKACSSPGFLQD